MIASRRAAPRRLRRPATAGQRGQSFVEYMVVTIFAVLLLVGSPDGSPSAIGLLVSAVKKFYTDYTFALSISSIPNCTLTKDVSVATVTVDKCFDLQDPSWPIKVDF